METTQSLQDYLTQKRQIVEEALEAYLPQVEIEPSRLHEAMRYSVFAGGKRLRPIMLLMTAEMLGQNCQFVAFAAAALEMIHTYSLIHDDLPAMDDDDLRRGKPTNHKVYGEAMAILAGDALLTMAFHIISDPKHLSSHLPPTIIAATNELAAAAGSLGMVGGQVLDIQAEGRQITLAELKHIHTLKTSQMITAALRIGAILSHATPQQLEKVTSYGENVGLAFQIVDDILDVEGDAAELGKNPESDLHKNKTTYATLYGVDRSKVLVQKLINTAKQSLHLFEERAYYFNQLADFIRLRTH